MLQRYINGNPTGEVARPKGGWALIKRIILLLTIVAFTLMLTVPAFAEPSPNFGHCQKLFAQDRLILPTPGTGLVHDPNESAKAFGPGEANRTSPFETECRAPQDGVSISFSHRD